MLLAAAGIAMVGFSWPQGALRTKLGVFLAAAAMIDLADTAVLLLRLYEFRPGLLPARIPDARLGAVLADYIFVPALVSVVVGAPRRYRVPAAVVAVMLFLSIEHVFTQRGVYVTQGWRLWHSAALFSLYFLLCSWWAVRFEQAGYTDRHRTLLVAGSLQYLWTVFFLLLDGVLQLYTFRPGLLHDPVRDNIAGGFLFHFVPFLLLGTTWVLNRWVESPAMLAMLAGIWVAWISLLMAGGMIRGRLPYGQLLAGVIIVAAVVTIGLLDRWYSRTDTKTKAGA